ncbi:MAG TPA: bifunctional phosphopantothenoylcysteine decarboxylase/phosphopantothenate--cysteine ligase CoaBC [Acidimicrobiia bacterium]
MRRVVLGVSGGVAAYKAVELCRRLIDADCFVSPVLTPDALRFVGKTTFDALGSEPARVELFGSPEPSPHTYLGQRADAIVVAPATANLLAKYRAGIADDLLTATLLATRAPVIVCPAMHTEMWEQPSVQENLAVLRARGVHVVDPEAGDLASGDVGMGRLAEIPVIVDAVLAVLGDKPMDTTRVGLLAGRRVLVTAGGTREPIDAVRVITNRSSGKQGYAIAAVAAARGAHVTLVTTVERPVPPGITDVVRVETAAEMQAAVMPRAPGADVIVMAAAVADFRPAAPHANKTKKQATPGWSPQPIELEATHDFLVDLGAAKPAGQVLVGFAAETEDLVANAADKLTRKRLDLIVANDVSCADAGFEVDTNRVVILSADGEHRDVPLQTKDAVAAVLLDLVEARLG